MTGMRTGAAGGVITWDSGPTLPAAGTTYYDTGAMFGLVPAAGQPVLLRNTGTDATPIWMPADGVSIGRFDSNADAWDYIAANNLDTNGDGTGDPYPGVGFYHAAAKVHRYWDDDAGAWVGQALYGPTLAADQTVHVETTGSDKTGDGLTVGTAYRSLFQAIQDVSRNSPTSTGAYKYKIQLGAGTFPLPAVLGQQGAPGVEIAGAPLAEDFTDTVAAVLADTRDGGRQIQLTAHVAMTPHEHKGKTIDVGGLLGVVYDNDANSLYMAMTFQVYGTLAPGMAVTVYDYTTILEVPSGANINVEGAVTITDCDVEVTGRLQFRRIGPTILDTVRLRLQDGSNFNQTDGGQLRLRGVYFRNESTGQRNLFLGCPAAAAMTVWEGNYYPNVIDGWDPNGGARRAYNSNGPGAQRWSVEGELVFADMVHMTVSNPQWDANDIDGETIIRIHNCDAWLSIENASGLGRTAMFLPRVAGTVLDGAQAFLRFYDNDDVGEALIRFLEGASVASPLGANVCQITAGTEGYYDAVNKIAIEGTGNDRRAVANMTITADPALTAFDGAKVLYADTSGGGFNLTLPDAAGLADLDPSTWRLLVILAVAGNNLVILPNGVTLYEAGGAVANHTTGVAGETMLITTDGVSYYLAPGIA